MAHSAELQPHPVFAGGSLLGWVLLDEPILGAEYVIGVFRPGPDFEAHRRLFEEAASLSQALRARADEDESAEDAALWQRWTNATEEIAGLGISVGDSREPVIELALYWDWRLELHPPGGRFGPPAPDLDAACARAQDLSPVPSHLEDWVGPATLRNDRLTAEVRCPCGGVHFEFHFTGAPALRDGRIVPSPVEVDGIFFFLIKVVCTNCRNEHVLSTSISTDTTGFSTTMPARPPCLDHRCVAGNAQVASRLGTRADCSSSRISKNAASGRAMQRSLVRNVGRMRSAASAWGSPAASAVTRRLAGLTTKHGERPSKPL